MYLLGRKCRVPASGASVGWVTSITNPSVSMLSRKHDAHRPPSVSLPALSAYPVFAVQVRRLHLNGFDR